MYLYVTKDVIFYLIEFYKWLWWLFR